MKKKITKWAQDLAIRIIKTVGEVGLAFITANAIVDITQINWTVFGATVALSVLATVLLNLSSFPSPDESESDE